MCNSKTVLLKWKSKGKKIHKTRKNKQFFYVEYENRIQFQKFKAKDISKFHILCMLCIHSIQFSSENSNSSSAVPNSRVVALCRFHSMFQSQFCSLQFSSVELCCSWKSNEIILNFHYGTILLLHDSFVVVQRDFIELYRNYVKSLFFISRLWCTLIAGWVELSSPFVANNCSSKIWFWNLYYFRILCILCIYILCMYRIFILWKTYNTKMFL